MTEFDVYRARHQFARRIFYDNLFDRYTDAQLRTPPHPSMNTLVWLMWHIARVEDTGVTRFVTREPQVLHSGAWNDKLKLSVAHNGFGATHDEMLAISQDVDMAALRAYWQAVIDYTLGALDRLTPERLTEVLSPEEVQQVITDEGVGHAQTQQEAMGIYSGWTRREALYHFSLTHYYWHGGEVRTIEGMMREPR